MTENELLEEEKKRLFSINIFCKMQEKMQGGISKWLLVDKENSEFKVSAIEDLVQYRTLGTVEEIRSKMEELTRWHSDRLNSRIKNEFAAMSTLICHNCDHKDEYIEELEAEVEEYRAIGTVDKCRAAVEMRRAIKPTFEMNYGDFESLFSCECGKKIIVRHNRGIMDNHNGPNYCSNCGKKWDWSDFE